MMDQKDMIAVMDDAVETGNLEKVLLLLSEGADVNGRNVIGHTPLLSAAWIGAASVVKLLLENEADLSVKGSQKKTALQIAKDLEFEDVVRLINEYMSLNGG